MSDKVIVEREGAVAIVTLNRPEAMNALDMPSMVAIGEAMVTLDADPSVRAIVLTSAGERAFCVGMDLKAFAADPEAFGEPDPNFSRFTKEGLGTPVIGAGNGAAVGGGMELLLACDLIILADHIKVGFPEVKRGLFAAGGGTRVSTRIPIALAMELVLTGDLIPAARALEIGLVNKVVPYSELRSAALELANKVAANGPLGLAVSKHLLVHAQSATPAQAWAEIARVAPSVFESADAKEGASAFLEKRAPAWSGR